MNNLDGDSPDLILPFAAIDRAMLLLAGGKRRTSASWFGRGFRCRPDSVLRTAAYEMVAADAGLEPTLAALAAAEPGDTARLAELAGEARSSLPGASVPDVLGRAIAEAYGELGDGAPVPVAVRSSATAEDLPGASFAGQQDTYLNVVGVESVLDAVRRCWASLWTDRAVSYRATNGIDPRGVRLAVVVQRMVDASVAGVLFTANPVTGKRHQAVIDASPGLGEAVVSGAVNPDHFVANAATGEIVERRLGDKRVAIVAGSGGGTETGRARRGRARCFPLGRPDPGSGKVGRAGRGALRDAPGHGVGHRRRRWGLAVAGAPDHDPLPVAGGCADERRGPARVLLLQRRPGRLRPANPDGHPGVPPHNLGRGHVCGPSTTQPLQRGSVLHRVRRPYVPGRNARAAQRARTPALRAVHEEHGGEDGPHRPAAGE